MLMNHEKPNIQLRNEKFTLNLKMVTKKVKMVTKKNIPAVILRGMILNNILVLTESKYVFNLIDLNEI